MAVSGPQYMHSASIAGWTSLPRRGKQVRLNQHQHAYNMNF